MAASKQAARQRRSATTKTAANSKTKARVKTKGVQGLRGYLSDHRAGEFDRLVYERVRLGIMSALAVNATLSFSDLRDLLKASDGNLSVHARKLEEAGYIGCKKSFEGRLPKTAYSLTAKGRRALERYLDHMEALIKATRQG
jgi:DNA-binding MarR family transcriptional regulator